jgi:hypothetical protein
MFFIFSRSCTFISLPVGSLVVFLIIGLMLGQNNGGIYHNIILILANAIWSLILTPIFLPLVLKVRKLTLTNRERI